MWLLTYKTLLHVEYSALSHVSRQPNIGKQYYITGRLLQQNIGLFGRFGECVIIQGVSQIHVLRNH